MKPLISETDEQVALRWINGDTLQQIANDHGVTREAVRLHVKRHLDGLGVTPKAVKAMHAEDAAKERRRRQQEADYRELLRRMSTAQPCAICDSWVLRGNYVTCSSQCARLLQTSARFWKSPERMEAHRRQQARSVLRSADKYGPTKVAWAKRMLSENPPPNRRFVSHAKRDLARQLGVSAIGRERLPLIPCVATNLDGSPCKRTVQTEGGVCHIHAGMQQAAS